VNGKLWYALSIIVGAVISAGILHFTKPSLVDEKSQEKKSDATEQAEVAK
jgi:PTS system fructose-specific IIC component/fructose-specific PTS system IIC-like component